MTPMFRIDVERTTSTCTDLVRADRHARQHYNGAGHRRLGVVDRDDRTLTVYYAQDTRP